MPQVCAACRRALEPTHLHYRFELTLQGEQTALDEAPGRPPATLEGLMAELEAADPDELEAQVHQAVTGSLCPSCRAQLLAWLGHAPRLH